MITVEDNPNIITIQIVPSCHPVNYAVRSRVVSPYRNIYEAVVIKYFELSRLTGVFSFKRLKLGE